MRAPGGSVITTYRSRAPGSAPRAWRWSKRARNARVWDALEDVRATTSQNAPGASARSVIREQSAMTRETVARRGDGGGVAIARGAHGRRRVRRRGGCFLKYR